MGTCGDPYPYRACMTEWRLILFQIWDRSSEPNFAFPGGRWNYGASYRWWYRPIAPRQLIRRKRCDMWTLMSCDLGRSTKRNELVMITDTISNLPIPVHTNQSNRWRPLNPIAYECRTRSLARIHFQPWWRNRRRIQQQLESYRSDHKPLRWV